MAREPIFFADASHLSAIDNADHEEPVINAITTAMMVQLRRKGIVQDRPELSDDEYAEAIMKELESSLLDEDEDQDDEAP